MLRFARIDATGAPCVHHQRDQKIVFSQVLKGMRTSSPVSSLASKKHQLSGFYNGEGGGEHLPRVSHGDYKTERKGIPHQSRCG